MSKLADQLIRQMSPAIPVPDVLGQLAALKQRYGTVTAAAKAAGIGRRTWQNIESGKSRHPRPGTLAKVKDEWAAGNPRRNESFNVKFTYDGRTRVVGPGQAGLAKGTAESMYAALDSGDREGVARAFLDGVTDEWYHDRWQDAYDEDLRGEEVSDIDDYNEGFAA